MADEKVQYDVVANLRASGSLGKQMQSMMGTAARVQRSFDKIQSSMASAGRTIMGTSAQTAVGWAKTGAKLSAAAGTAGMGGLLHSGLAFNDSMESSRNSIGAVYQLYGQNQGNVLKNLKQAEGVQRNLFELAKKSPGEYEDAVNVYKGAARGLIVANETIGAQMEFMKDAIMLPKVVGSGLNSDVVGGQLGRIIMGGAGAEFETWKVLAPAILEVGQNMKGANGQAKIFAKSMRPGQDLTSAWNELAQAQPEIAMKVLKQSLVPLRELAGTFEESWDGILGTTSSNIKMITGAFTKPFFEARKKFLSQMSKKGIFAEGKIEKLEYIATAFGIMFAKGSIRLMTEAERAVAYMRDHWQQVSQKVYDAFQLGSAAVKGAFAFGLFRMMAGAAMIAASFAMKGLSQGKKAAGFMHEKGAQAAYLHQMKKSGLDLSQRPRDSKGQYVSYRKAFQSLQEKRGADARDKYSKGVFKYTAMGPIMEFFTKMGPMSLVLAAGVPIIVMLVGAFGALFTIVGGIAAYVVSNWKAISGAIVTGLRDGTITLGPLLIAAYTFWERLKMVGEVFLGGGGHAAQFARVLDMMTGAVAFAANAVGFFMRSIAYSLGIWGALKLAFQGVLKAVLAIIEMSQYLPGVGASDEFVAHAQNRYKEFADSTQDTWTTVDKLLSAADDIDAFTFKQLDFDRINKEASEMEKTLAKTLEDMGKEDPNKKKGPKGPKVQINHLTINQDLRDTDPDRLMAAFITPLERLADKRIQAWDMTEQGA
jgi:hypothetical protein